MLPNFQRFWNWYFTFTNYIKTKHISLKDTNILKGHRDKMPILCAFPSCPTAPSSDTEVCRRESEIAHNHALPFYCMSNMRCRYFSVWSSHGSVAREDNGAYYFQWAPSEVSMGLLSLEQRHIGKQHYFLVIKMAEFVWSWRTPLLFFLFSPAGFERAKKDSLQRSRPDSLPSALCPGQMNIRVLLNQ